MAILSVRIYLTANLLIAAVILFTGLPIEVAIAAGATVFSFSTLFSLPAGFALYYCLKLIDVLTRSVWQKWIVFHILLFIVALIPYLIVQIVLSGDSFDSNDFLIVLYLSEGSAFFASLLNCIAIHRLFKNSSYENS